MFANRNAGSAGTKPLYHQRFDHTPMPDPTAEYKLQVRFRLPAGSVQDFLSQILISDYTLVETQILGGRGTANSNPNPTQTQTVPVTLVESILNSGLSVAANYLSPVYVRHSGFANATGNSVNTTLSASATHTGTFFYQLGSNDPRVTARVVVRHTGASLGTGTLVYLESTDASTFREIRRWPVPNDGNYHSFDLVPSMEYARCDFINGAVAATNFFFRIQQLGLAVNKPTEMLHYQESVTPLSGSATLSGITLDVGMTPQYNIQRAFVYADVAGTLNLQQSRDGTNWRTLQSQAVGAGEAWTVEAPVSLRYCRVQYVNGAGAQSAFELYQTLVPLEGA
jgi:hypothetical protein